MKPFKNINHTVIPRIFSKKGMFKMRYIIVTGMSGAGKSFATGALEDLGMYCIDNMPVALISKFAELYAHTGEGGESKRSDVVFGVDVRGESSFEPLLAEVSALKELGYECNVLFMDCSDTVLLNRYKETRRIHPLVALNNIPISDALAKERQLLERVNECADYRIDTTYLSTQQTREQLQNLFGKRSKHSLFINVISFGFKNGNVAEADLTFDVRCFPNPHYIPELRPHTGLEAPVREYVMSFPQTIAFLEKLYELIDYLLPLYAEEGKRQLTVAIGCTGGKHRSVAIAEALTTHFKDRGENAVVTHRDILNGKG